MRKSRLTIVLPESQTHPPLMQTQWFRFFADSRYRNASALECRLIELRISAALAVRRLRRRQRLTQQQLAEQMGIAQTRVSGVEQVAERISLDVYAQALIALGASDNEIADAFNAGRCLPVQQLRRRAALPYYPRTSEPATLPVHLAPSSESK